MNPPTWFPQPSLPPLSPETSAGSHRSAEAKSRQLNWVGIPINWLLVIPGLDAEGSQPFIIQAIHQICQIHPKANPLILPPVIPLTLYLSLFSASLIRLLCRHCQDMDNSLDRGSVAFPTPRPSLKAICGKWVLYIIR